MLFRTSVVSVDVMRDTSEDVLSTLTCCFSGGGGVPELGLGEAEKLCILTAWKRHITLVENARKYVKGRAREAYTQPFLISSSPYA